MEQIRLPYSLKNIPMASENEYLKQFVGQLSKFQHNLTWRVYNYLNPKAPRDHNENYEFKCEYTPPRVDISGGRRCDLCLQEKLTICLADPKTTLNSRSEMVSKCRHKRNSLKNMICFKTYFISTI